LGDDYNIMPERNLATRSRASMKIIDADNPITVGEELVAETTTAVGIKLDQLK
jgi:hypothetical protein